MLCYASGTVTLDLMVDGLVMSRVVLGLFSSSPSALPLWCELEAEIVFSFVPKLDAMILVLGRSTLKVIGDGCSCGECGNG